MPDLETGTVADWEDRDETKANTGEPRYWVYTHDETDELVDSLGYFDGLEEAIKAALEEILGYLVLSEQTNITARVVDNEADATTVWWAGPKERETPSA